jgi:hypothetical protein
MASERPRLRVALAGDTILGRNLAQAIARTRRAPIAPEVVDVAAEADVFIVNLECCISDRGLPRADPRKLDCVATDMMGKSGRAMLDALVSRTADPVVLADPARGLLRKKIPRSEKRSRAASTPSTRWSSGGSSRTWTTWTRRSTSSRARSRSNSARSRRRLSCCARSPASAVAPPR